MQKLLDLIKNIDLALIYKNYTAEQIVEELSFKESMRLAYKMFNNKEYDDDLYDFAANLLQCIRKRYSQNWELDWRNDLFLGDVCHFTRRFEERYKAYKYASLKFDKLDLPPSLLVSLARCYNSPGEPPVSIEDAEKLSKAAIEKKTSIEAVTLIRGICKIQGRQKEFFYWDKILKNLRQKNVYMDNDWPKWLMEDSKLT